MMHSFGMETLRVDILLTYQRQSKNLQLQQE